MVGDGERSTVGDCSRIGGAEELFVIIQCEGVGVPKVGEMIVCKWWVWRWGEVSNSGVKEDGNLTGFGIIVVTADGGDGAGDNGGWSGGRDGLGERSRVGVKGWLGLVRVVPAGKPSAKWEGVETVGGSEGWTVKLDRCHVGKAVL